jgi:glucose-1-phosphate adenylyltransferase
MVSGGCLISGSTITRSLLFSRCHAHSHSKITDSVVLPDVDIGRHCRIDKAIIDRGCILEEGMVIGEDKDEDRERGFRITDSGITLVTPDMLGQHLHFTR